MVTASHNPPSDNAVKVYWSTGGQILPPHDEGIIDRVMNVQEIERASFDQGVADGRVSLCKSEIDNAFLWAVSKQAFSGPRTIKIIYSPLHGVGATAVCPTLAADGFDDVEIFALHAQPDGDFPNVPGHVANPENAAVFDSIIEHAREVSADVILATDPDCDRLGCAAPRTADPHGDWATFTGNQIGALLVDYVLEQRQRAGTLSPDHYIVKTLVTTEMIRRIAEAYGVTTCGNLMVGFKWIAGVMDERGADRFVFGAEESHGYLVGSHVRDKDAVVASMLMAELAAACRARGQSLHEKLDALFWQHGYHAERLSTQRMEGSQGMARMEQLMDRFRREPPSSLGGMPVRAVRDYENGVIITGGKSTEPLDGPTGDLVILELAQEGNYVAARPSGTEPKIKFYMFTFVPAEQLADLSLSKQEMEDRLDALETDIGAYVATASKG
jgi:phosphoglucomutase/phosphomannomutase